MRSRPKVSETTSKWSCADFLFSEGCKRIELWSSDLGFIITRFSKSETGPQKEHSTEILRVNNPTMPRKAEKGGAAWSSNSQAWPTVHIVHISILYFVVTLHYYYSIAGRSVGR